jgi:hypothetical protein
MRGSKQLESVSTEDLVKELKRRFAAVEEAKAFLLGDSGTLPTAKRGRKTMSAAARARISAAQKARWAKAKGRKSKKAASASA